VIGSSLWQCAPDNGSSPIHGEEGEVAQLGQRPHVDQCSVAKDPHPIAQCLHFTQDVRRQEHGLASFARLVDATAEGLFHQRVQSAGGLVEKEQVRPGHERRDQDELLPVAFGVGTNPFGGIEVEALDQLVTVDGINIPLYLA